MKRDMDLIRSILINIEQAQSPLDIAAFYELTDNKDVIHYHLQLLAEHKLIDAAFHKSWSGEVIGGTIQGLTWDGQDLLDAMRDNRVWHKAKTAITQTIGTTTFNVIKETCSLVALEMVKKHIGA